MTYYFSFLGSPPTNIDRMQVLIYNYFKDSTCDLSQWRLVLNFLESSSKTAIAPQFDEIKHAGICTEVLVNFRGKGPEVMIKLLQKCSLSFFT
jgi:hypothetical protein